MTVQSLNDAQAWERFMKVTQAARIRNAALAVPVRSSRPVPQARAAVKAGTGVREGSGTPVTGGYGPVRPQGPVQVVGTRFDAWA